MEETYLQKKRRIMGRQFLREYINQLKQILRSSISEKNFISIVDTDRIIAQYRNKKLVQKNIIGIADKKQLIQIVTPYLNGHKDPYYIWILHSYDCGLYKINSVTDLNWEYIKAVDENEMIIIFYADHEVKLDLNYEDEGKFIEISIYQTDPFLT